MMCRVILTLLAFLFAAGCVNTTEVTPSQVSRATTASFNVGDLPDPSKWSNERIYFYFMPNMSEPNLVT